MAVRLRQNRGWTSDTVTALSKWDALADELFLSSFPPKVMLAASTLRKRAAEITFSLQVSNVAGPRFPVTKK